MTATETRELIRELNAEMNAGNLDIIPEVLADDYEEGPETVRTPEEIADEVRWLRSGFPDWHEELMVLATSAGMSDPDKPEWAQGEFVLAQYEVTGTHEGEFLGVPPTGNEIETAVVRSFSIDDGEIAIWRWLMGDFTLYRSVGIDVDALLDDIPTYASD